MKKILITLFSLIVILTSSASVNADYETKYYKLICPAEICLNDGTFTVSVEDCSVSPGDRFSVYVYFNGNKLYDTNNKANYITYRVYDENGTDIITDYVDSRKNLLSLRANETSKSATYTVSADIADAKYAGRYENTISFMMTFDPVGD